MSGLISSLHTGQSGLTVNQIGIEVSGNNVANANTEGYSRQVAQVTSTPALAFNGTFVGQGASVSGISRTESALVTSQLVSKNADYGEAAAQTEPLATLESIVGISEGNLSSAMDDFFDAWQALSSNPGESVEREEVLQRGEQLADTFVQMDQGLADLQESINQNITSEVDTLNSQLAQIADLNTRIVSMEAGGVAANGLRDERDLLLQEVAGTAGIQYYEMNNGAVSVQLASGVPLVIAGDSFAIATERTDGKIQLSVDTGSSSTTIDSDDLGGTLKGLMTVRDETIEEARSELDQLAWQFAESVNSVHSSGVDLDGNSGSAFFSLVASSDPDAPWSGAAGSISLALTDSDQVAAGTLTGSNTQSGDNTNTLLMTALQGTATMGENTTFQDYYDRIAAGIGTTVSRNTASTESSEDALVQLQNLRDAISGVSVDEEMVLLTQYQSGYEAAAKYLSVVQDMLDTLMAL